MVKLLPSMLDKAPSKLVRVTLGGALDKMGNSIIHDIYDLGWWFQFFYKKNHVQNTLWSLLQMGQNL